MSKLFSAAFENNFIGFRNLDKHKHKNKDINARDKWRNNNSNISCSDWITVPPLEKQNKTK